MALTDISTDKASYRFSEPIILTATAAGITWALVYISGSKFAVNLTDNDDGTWSATMYPWMCGVSGAVTLNCVSDDGSDTVGITIETFVEEDLPYVALQWVQSTLEASGVIDAIIRTYYVSVLKKEFRGSTPVLAFTIERMDPQDHLMGMDDQVDMALQIDVTMIESRDRKSTAMPNLYKVNNVVTSMFKVPVRDIITVDGTDYSIEVTSEPASLRPGKDMQTFCIGITTLNVRVMTN